jgi:hypothetical protein
LARRKSLRSIDVNIDTKPQTLLEASARKS